MSKGGMIPARALSTLDKSPSGSHENAFKMLAEAKTEGVDSYNDALVNNYFGETKRGLSERRKKKIRLTLGKLGREFLRKPLDSVSKDDLEEFLDELYYLAFRRVSIHREVTLLCESN
jgi:hypothetical protein